MSADRERIELITKDEAVAALRRCAFTETNDDGSDGRTIVHNFITSGPFMLGADWDLDSAVDLVGRSGACAWLDSMWGTCLAVRAEREPGTEDYVQYEFDGVRPEATR